MQIRIEGHNLMVNGEISLPFGVVDHCGPDEYKRIKGFDFGINCVATDTLFKDMEADGELTEPDRLPRILDEAERNGFLALVLLGGAAPPDWLFERYPDCGIKGPDGNDAYGGWYKFSFNHPGVREELKRYYEIVVNSIKDHPALLGWILWNEPYLLPGVDYHPCTIDEFRSWLGNKYQHIGELNRLWSSSHSGFDDTQAPVERTRTDPVAWTDWQYFREQNHADFFRWQSDIIRKDDPNHVITTKIRKPLDLRDDSADQRSVSTRLWAESFCDAVGFDPYAMHDDAHEVRLFADFMRGMSGGRPMWDTEAAFVPYEGRGRPSAEMQRSAFWMKFARGVNGTWFYEWAPERDSSLAYTYSPDKEPEPGMYVLQECFRHLTSHQDLLGAARMVQPRVAVLHSKATLWHHHGDFTHTADLTTVINCLYRKHIPYDYIDEADINPAFLARYGALIVVGTRNISDASLSVIHRYIESGGYLLANVRFAESDECGRKRESHPPEWLGARARKCTQSPRKKTGSMRLERVAIDHHRQPVEVNLIADTYESRSMRVSKQSPMVGLPAGTSIGSGDLYGYAGYDQMAEQLDVLGDAEVVATFDGNEPAIVTTPRTMYIARDTSWISREFADLIESFVLHAGVTRLAYARDASGREVAPIDLVLCETQDRYVLYVTALPKTFRYDGSPLTGVRVGLPGRGAPTELFSGTELQSREAGDLNEVELDFAAGQAMVLTSRK